MTRFTQRASDEKVTLSPLDGDMITRTVDAVLGGLPGYSAALSLFVGFATRMWGKDFEDGAFSSRLPDLLRDDDGAVGDCRVVGT